jgi:glycosyltransferase involved in cell wall biosynthesis
LKKEDTQQSIKQLITTIETNLKEDATHAQKFEKSVNEVKGMLSVRNHGKQDKPYLFQTLINDSLYNVDDLINRTASVPVSNGSKYFEGLHFKVGFIGSNHFYEKFKNIRNLIQIDIENHKEVPGLDSILVVPERSADYEGLEAAIDFYKEKGTPIFFYGINDPISFEETLPLAKKADYIFTHAIETIYDYQENCINAKNIESIMFPVNPLVHNPIGSRNKIKDTILYADGWRFEEKFQKNLDLLLDTVIESKHDLMILEDSAAQSSSPAIFTEKYYPYIVDNQVKQSLENVYKAFDYVLCLNENQKSQSAFSNRVNEALSTGACVITNYQPGVYSKFPNVLIVANKTVSRKLMDSLDPEELYEIQMEGVRRVFNNSTIFDLMQRMKSLINQESQEWANHSILVVVNKKTDNVLQNFNRQSYSNKEIIEVKDLKAGILKKYKMVTFFHEDYKYGEYYLEDLVNGFKYTNSSYVTKNSYYQNGVINEGIQHNYVNNMEDKYKTAFWVADFKPKELLNMNVLDGVLGYSIDPLELEVGKKEVSNQNKKSLKMSVVMPIYSNGRHLLYKSFMSLKRSSMFDEMEIILVDDGSKDTETPLIVKRLERKYPNNVVTHLFGDGGSGSASRPRNKATALATTDWLVYLDPDDEMINDGFAKLYKKVSNTDLNIAIGEKQTLRNEKLFSSNVKKYFKKNIYLNENNQERITADALSKSNYTPSSMSTLIINREWLLSTKVEQVEGCFGQDSLFYQQVVSKTDKVGFLDLPVYLYYGEVEGSAVNNINKKYFEKYITLETARIKWLKEDGLFEDYKETRLEDYFINWYFKKLNAVIPEDREDAEKYLMEIIRLYGDFTFKRKESLKFLNELKTSKAMVN